MKNGKAVFETKYCVGCKTCMLACSYHHRGVFSLNFSSIAIKDLKQNADFRIEVYKSNKIGQLACDKCGGEDEPLCIKYCNHVARGELAALLKASWG